MEPPGPRLLAGVEALLAFCLRWKVGFWDKKWQKNLRIIQCRERKKLRQDFVDPKLIRSSGPKGRKDPIIRMI